MYTIVSGGELLSICEQPRYVRRKPETGVYVEATAEAAEAIAINGELYNLPGGTAIAGQPEAFVSEADVGEFTFSNHVQLAENGTEIENIELAVCEQESATEDRLSAIELAVCQLDAAINGEAE